MIKKTLLVTLDFPPMLGGVANYWANLNKFLPSDRFLVLAPEFDDTLDFDIKQNYLIYRKNLISKEKYLWPRWLPLLYETFKLVRQESIKKIIVTHILPVGIVAYLLKIFLRIPYVVSIHGLDINLTQASTRKRWITRRIINNADTIIVNSNFTKQLLAKTGCCNTVKVEVVYPCPNINYDDNLDLISDFKEQTGIIDKKVLLTVSRLIERKGHDKVIQALPKVLEKFANLVYLVVGQGPQLKYLIELVSMLKLEKNVFFYNDIVDYELPKFYAAADIFVMPVRKVGAGDIEGFGIVYLEANSFGKPVIAGQTGGAVEAVEDGVNGLLVDPESINAIAAAIIKVLENEEMARSLGNTGKLRIAKKFNWAEQSKVLIDVLSR